MKKDYQKVNSILNVDGLDFDNSGKVTLSEEQVKALNDKVGDLEKDSSDKQTLIDQKEEQINNLKKSAGDDTHHIEGEEGEQSNIFKDAKDLYDSI